jgi:hypothetical protein|tara:strand:- start:4557 stop:4883 length:327 start_codon:yes stop_codon:yes gene_type:complete
MNKMVMGIALASVLASQSVKAGDREWATVGKVLTGVAVVHVIDRIVNPPPQVVYVQQPVVVQQPVIVQPTPVVYVQPAPVVYYAAPSVVVYPTPVYYGHYHHHHHWHR